MQITALTRYIRWWGGMKSQQGGAGIMAASETGPAFHAITTRALKREGFVGDYIWVDCREGRLELIGEKAGQIRLAPKDIQRLRIGYEETKYSKIYQTVIWRQGAAKPLDLTPLSEHRVNYAVTVRVFAGQMVASGFQNRVERGVSKFSAILGPVLIGILVLAALCISIFVLTEEPWWGRMIVPFIPIVLLGFLIWNMMARQMPRPIRNLAELDKQLP
ncbi:hypothetical protein [Hypericibacter sp.]|uniref:hypothetical protein n=1 Tax=Hypericibacter sp. TaxID=2705401 RepID=UPI003D6CE38C